MRILAPGERRLGGGILNGLALGHFVRPVFNLGKKERPGEEMERDGTPE